MTSENFVHWLMGFLSKIPLQEKETVRDNPGSGLTVKQYKEILKALNQIEFK